MKARFVNWCQAKGFDAIEPDNVDGWTNISNITQADNLAYDLAIAQLAHALPLSIGLKNLATDLSGSQLPMFVGAFDWALNEQCYEYSECDAYTQAGSFLPAGKAVFDVEYNTSPNCTQANQCAHQRPADRSGLGRRDGERLQVHAVRARQPGHLVSATGGRLRALTGAGLFAGVASCANLGALVCQGDDCLDASSESAGDGGEPGIACGAGSVCDPRSQECCVASGGSDELHEPLGVQRRDRHRLRRSTSVSRRRTLLDLRQRPGLSGHLVQLPGRHRRAVPLRHDDGPASLPSDEPVRRGPDVQAVARRWPRRGRGRDVVLRMPVGRHSRPCFLRSFCRFWRDTSASAAARVTLPPASLSAEAR